jgi:hypothetical protein
MNNDDIYARSKLLIADDFNWETVFLLLNDDKLMKIAKEPRGGVISYKKFSLIQAVLTYPKLASKGIEQIDLDKAHACAKIIKFNISSGVIKLKTKKLSPYLIGHHPGVKNNPSI